MDYILCYICGKFAIIIFVKSVVIKKVKNKENYIFQKLPKAFDRKEILFTSSNDYFKFRIFSFIF
jgi:hypothetical protein